MILYITLKNPGSQLKNVFFFFFPTGLLVLFFLLNKAVSFIYFY